MAAPYTPLRYPGGKSKLGPYISDVLRFNKLTDGHFAEPYAGGAGAALFLLLRGYTKTIHLNDIDPAVASFWQAVLRHTERFARVIETIPLSVEEWDRQRKIYTSRSRGFDLGLAFFYLNRTNRSGIMNGGIIGGRRQSGEWRLDARFNRSDLAARIRRIGAMRRLISISSDDALDFMSGLRPNKLHLKTFIYLDPPYFHKGRELYTNFYTPDDHASIAQRLRRLGFPWLLTYDDCSETRALYSTFEMKESELSYSAREVRRGREIVVFSPRVRPPAMTARRDGFRLL